MGSEIKLIDLLKSEIPYEQEPDFVLMKEKEQGRVVGLALVDISNGFCTVGAGNFAPTKPDKQIETMVEEAERLCRLFCEMKWPIFALLDTHYPHKPEPPYPPHCLIGSGEEDIIPALEWLENEPNFTARRKYCIDGYVGSMDEDGSNALARWIKENEVNVVLTIGICTDVCVFDFASSALSARNIDLLPPLQDVVLYSKGCATYDLPIEEARHKEGVLSHPQDVMHYMGLYMLKGRGARIVQNVSLGSSPAV